MSMMELIKVKYNTSTRAGVQVMIQEKIDGSFEKLREHFSNNDSIDGAVALAMFVRFCQFLGASGSFPYGKFLGDNENMVLGKAEKDVASVDGKNPIRAGGDVTLIDTHAHSAIKNMPEQYIKMFIQALANSAVYCIELGACHQVRALTEKNIQGYFMEVGHMAMSGGLIVRVLNLLAYSIDDIAADGELREQISSSTFVSYHIKASSTPALIMRFASETPHLYDAMVDHQSQEVVDEAFMNQWDIIRSKKIPARVIVITGAYLRANGALPDGWRQFDAARQVTPAPLYQMALSFFAKYKELDSDALIIDQATSRNQLLLRIPDLLSSGAIPEDVVPEQQLPIS